MATTIPLHHWLSHLILREKRRQDAHKREANGDSNNCIKKNKAVQLEYIETAVSVALLLVQSLIVNTSLSLAAQQIAIENFSVVIDGDIDLEENPEDENLQRIIESVTQLKFTPPSVEDDSSTHAKGEQQESENDDLLRGVGTLLHQLFCRGIKPAAVSITDVYSPDEEDSDEDQWSDNEQPGAEKGRKGCPKNATEDEHVQPGRTFIKFWRTKKPLPYGN
mmetsp:Transcript_4775/g.8112  ORF Transcript_4775/g.8112 Transcript_4775/m.8112 type:complete len:221 (-) Transcript_4775:1647-2309(-)